MAPMTLRRSLLLLALVVITGKVIAVALTRHGVGPIEYVTLAAIVALLLVTAFRLTRRTVIH